MDYNKLYEGIKKRQEEAADTPITPQLDLPPLNLSDATPVLLERAIAAARISDDPKVIIPVLDALLKRGHAEANNARIADIRKVMSLLTAEQLDQLEKMV